jgi:hypothetical protein
VLRAGPRLSCSEGASSSMAEQRTLNPQVLGSNPRGRTVKTSSEAHSSEPLLRDQGLGQPPGNYF